MKQVSSILKNAPITIRETAQHLAVIESKVSKDGVDREIQKIDPALFIDAEWDAQFGALCYVVKVHIGHGATPPLLTDWREPGTRRPLELSSGLIGKVQRLASERGVDRLREIAEENQRMKDYHEAQLHEARIESAIDMAPRMRGTKSTIMPRATTAAGVASARRRQARRDVERKLGIR